MIAVIPKQDIEHVGLAVIAAGCADLCLCNGACGDVLDVVHQRPGDGVADRGHGDCPFPVIARDGRGHVRRRPRHRLCQQAVPVLHPAVASGLGQKLFTISRIGPRAGVVRSLKSGAGCTSSRASRRSTSPTEPLGGQGYARVHACVGAARLRGRGGCPARDFSGVAA